MDSHKKEAVISKRLRTICEMVTPGKKVVDVGCDHGFADIYLIQKGISPQVIAMDVREGPLSRAREHIGEYGLENYIETRLSDGLGAYQTGEAQAMVCAGMGGRLMQKILTEESVKAKSLDELILQPQSELADFRKFLRRNGYRIHQENILWEEGKYYFLMKVSCPFCEEESGEAQDEQYLSPMEGNVCCGKLAGNIMEERSCLGKQQESTMEESGGSGECGELYDRFGGLLLQRRDPVLRQYLEESLRTAKEIEGKLAFNENDRAKERLKEIRQEIFYLQQALLFYQ